MVPWDRKSCRLGGHAVPAPCASLADKESPPAGGDEPPLAANAASRLGVPGGEFLGMVSWALKFFGAAPPPFGVQGEYKVSFLIGRKKRR